MSATSIQPSNQCGLAAMTPAATTGITMVTIPATAVVPAGGSEVRAAVGEERRLDAVVTPVSPLVPVAPVSVVPVDRMTFVIDRLCCWR